MAQVSLRMQLHININNVVYREYIKAIWALHGPTQMLGL